MCYSYSAEVYRQQEQFMCLGTTLHKFSGNVYKKLSPAFMRARAAPAKCHVCPGASQIFPEMLRVIRNELRTRLLILLCCYTNRWWSHIWYTLYSSSCLSKEGHWKRCRRRLPNSGAPREGTRGFQEPECPYKAVHSPCLQSKALPLLSQPWTALKARGRSSRKSQCCAPSSRNNTVWQASSAPLPMPFLRQTTGTIGPLESLRTMAIVVWFLSTSN